MDKLKKSLQNINWRLFAALVVMGMCPTIYTTVRTYFIGSLPNEWAYSIAGQLSWVNLIYEIANEAIILPLFFFMSKAVDNKKEFTNRLKTGLIVTFAIYALFSVGIMFGAKQMLAIMATSAEIITESAKYIRIESVANIFGILFSFMSVSMVSIGKDKLIYFLTFIKLFLCVIVDTFLVSALPCSLNLGVNGIGYSNIIVNVLLILAVIIILKKEGCSIFEKNKISFAWMGNFAKIGAVSGIESFVRNTAYMLMVSRMVNMVGEQGTYWVANNFIWGWLLLPIIQFGELIKQETAKDENNITKNTLGYFVITGIVCILWVLLVPIYKPFMKYILGFSDVNKLFDLVMLLLLPYIFYAFQNVFDSTFYGRGKTNYMLIESIVTNTIYYGTFFVLYLLKIWTPTLMGIALMFGFGNIFDSIVSAVVYGCYLKKKDIRIW